jgi:hypothetical protein
MNCVPSGMAQPRGKLQVQPCPQFPVSDSPPEKGGLSLRATLRLKHCSKNGSLLDHRIGGADQLIRHCKAEGLRSF